MATSQFCHYFHTDSETPDAVPWTGLDATARAYAKIIDEVNKLPLSDLQPPRRATAQSVETARAAVIRETVRTVRNLVKQMLNT